ncbi:hypothetical protein HRbin15_01985 [bacterium HR15]|nr:hypothetical protein HRbin15_01985 [bacterium HR15]
MSKIGLLLAVAALLGAGAAALVMSLREGKPAPSPTAVVKGSGEKPSCCAGH